MDYLLIILLSPLPIQGRSTQQWVKHYCSRTMPSLILQILEPCPVLRYQYQWHNSPSSNTGTVTSSGNDNAAVYNTGTLTSLNNTGTLQGTGSTIPMVYIVADPLQGQKIAVQSHPQIAVDFII